MESPTRTVMRDLEAFRKLGQEVEWEKDEDGRYVWTYRVGIETLFVANLSESLRERLRRLP